MSSIARISELFITYEIEKTLDNLDYSETGTKRICFHENDSSELQVMLIELKPNSYFPYHKHPDSMEVIIVRKGGMNIEYEEDLSCNNTKINKIYLDEINNTTLILKKGIWHSNSTGERPCRYLEIKVGPFSKFSTVLR